MAVPVFTLAQLLWLAAQVANGHGNVDIAAAVMSAESSGRPDAYNDNTDAQHSRDRGLAQINNYWHPEVSDRCAYTPLCNVRNMYRISNGFTDFSQWSTYTSGLYLNHMPPALLPETPIPAVELNTYYPPHAAPQTGLVAGTNPFTGTVGIAPPAPAGSQDHSAKTVQTGRRAGLHGSSLNDAANAIHRIPVGRSRY